MRSVDISVILTNYNYALYIRRCLRSLLHQDLDRSRYEIIVVDDKSQDNSLAILKPYAQAGEIRLVANRKNLGVGACARLGVDHALGKYVVRVDADDYVQPPFLYMLYNFLRFNPAYVGVSCDYFVTDNEERIHAVESFRENGLACGLMLRTSYLEIIGSYNHKKRIFEDKDLFERLNWRKIYHLPLPLYNYVKHGRSLTDRTRKFIR
ncbi:MAG: glycosyltransferase family 2 protein [Candidatus Omnitrophica bacterium]|nr:glycosyltransferase family 2 protein [Candidatus Omnitrophota bacterium]